MKKPTSILVNIITGALAFGVLALGYFTFFNTNTPSTPDIAVGDETLLAPVDAIVATSLEVADTAEKLSTLSRSVASSTEILNTQAFQSLTDFSTVVPQEPIGREFPFSKTDWRLSLEAAERAAELKAASSAARATATVAPTPVPSFTSTTTATTTAATTTATTTTATSTPSN